MRKTILQLALLVAATGACSEGRNAGDTAAGVAGDTVETQLAVAGGRIWYRISGSGTGTPVILLHGGPGFASYYLKPLEELGSDRKVVRYDQLGGGKSDQTSDTTLFTIDHFVRELDSLRSHLGYPSVHLVGHSWGSILAVEYYRAHPEHVTSMVLAGPALDIPQWARHAKQLATTLSDSAQRAIRTREAEQNFEAPDYQNAVMEFYGKYVWLRPDEANLDSLFQTANAGIYNYMQGPSEFTITGTLKQYDATPFLGQIKVPVLYVVGEVDEADTATVRKFSAATPGSRMVVIPDAAHLMTWDNPEATLSAVQGFLREVDAGGTP